MKPLRIAVLGCTGSIGVNTVRTVRALAPRVEIGLLAARGNNPEVMARQAAEFRVSSLVVTDPEQAERLRRLSPDFCKVSGGMNALCDAVASDDIDLVLCAIAGSEGLRPALAALHAGKRLALATKEVMVMGGHVVTELAKRKNITIFPVDSEHSAVFQCLEGRDPETVQSLILTASGGPFRDWTREQMEKVTPEQALKHPTWSMGPKITIDSASLMNKALEVVEARWLFDMPGDKIEVVIHPQSIVHSMIRLKDGVVLAQMGVPDMRHPIQYALTAPERIDSGLETLDFVKVGRLDFLDAPEERFPSIGFARDVLRKGGTYPAAMNAANEIARDRFCKGEIGFTDIWSVVEKTLENHESLDERDLEHILEADRRARAFARIVKVK